MVDRLTREQAARRLGVTTRTLDRRIRAGDIDVERETTGSRRIHVLLDTVETPDNGVEPVETNGHYEDLLAENASLRTLVDHLREERDFERTRYSQIYHDLKTGALALPAPKSRPWWRFWG